MPSADGGGDRNCYNGQEVKSDAPPQREHDGSPDRPRSHQMRCTITPATNEMTTTKAGAKPQRQAVATIQMEWQRCSPNPQSVRTLWGFPAQPVHQRDTSTTGPCQFSDRQKLSSQSQNARQRLPLRSRLGALSSAEWTYPLVMLCVLWPSKLAMVGSFQPRSAARHPAQRSSATSCGSRRSASRRID